MLRDFGSATRCRCGMSGVVGVHFSPSRTSRPVGCRPTARTVDCRVAFTRVHAADLRCSRPTARRYGTLKIGIEPHIACVLAPRQARPARIYGPSAVAGCSTRPLSRGCPRTGSHSKGYRSATLLLWVLSGPVLKHGPRSLTCARVIGIHCSTKPKGAMKVKIVLSVDRGRMARVTMRARTPGASRAHCEQRRTQSVHVGTRKMVNYAWSGRSQGKP